LSPCDPSQTNAACVELDEDGDGYKSNYPEDHAEYDLNDQNACEPEGSAAQCGCPDEDGDGFIYVCNMANLVAGPQTVSVRVEDWNAQQAGGSYCGPCQDTIFTGCEVGVNLLSSTTVTAKGEGDQGHPSIQNFYIPQGENRRIILLASFEREHCRDPQYCYSSNTNGAGLGDDYAASSWTNHNGDAVPRISARFTSTSGSIERQNDLAHYGYQYVRPLNATDRKAYLSREVYPIMLEEAVIQALLGGSNSGNINITLPGVSLPQDNADEAMLTALVFENVAQDTTGVILAGWKFKPMNEGHPGNYTLTIESIDAGYDLQRVEQGLVLFGMSGQEAGFHTTNAFEEIEKGVVSNSNGAYTGFNEGDGFSTTVQFRNGTVGNPINQFSLQAAGNAADNTNGGFALTLLLNPCSNNDPTGTPPVNYIDNDNDGYYANVYSSNSTFDPDDANACVPDPTNANTTCTGIDADQDGYFGNYPTEHELFDSNDSDACFPVSQTCATCVDHDEDGFYVVCKRVAGSAAGQTQLVTVNDWSSSQQPGDYCGPCADFITIADGNWEDAAVWKNGQIPPTLMDGINVIVNHQVTAYENVNVTNNSYLWVQDGKLTINGPDTYTSDLRIYDGTAYFVNAIGISEDDLKLVDPAAKLISNNSDWTIKGVLEMVEGDAKIWNGVAHIGELTDYQVSDEHSILLVNPSANLHIKGATITSEHNLQVTDGFVLAEDACLVLKRNLIANGDLDFQNTCIEIDSDYYTSNNHTSFTATSIHLTGIRPDNTAINYGNNFGRFRSLGTVSGELEALYVADGDTEVNNWAIPINYACINGPNTIPTEYILNSDCNATASIFDACSCINYSITPPVQLVEICDNGIDDDGDGNIDCADGDCENIFSNGSFNFVPSTKIGDGTWTSNNSTVQTNLGETVFLQWEPNPAPSNISATWTNPSGGIVGNGNYLSIANFQTTNAGAYILELASDAGCLYTHTYDISIVGQEICDNGIDDDGDGNIDCADGDCIGQTNCLPKVNLINSIGTSAIGEGTNGIPAISNFQIPAGNNRVVVLLATFERNHCQDATLCSSNNTTYDGLGDSYTNANYPAAEKDQTITFQISGSSETLTKVNSTGDAYGNFHSATSMVWFPENNGTDESEDYYKAVYSMEHYFVVLKEAEINTLLNQSPNGNINVSFPNIQAPTDDADDAILMAMVFENVDQNSTGVTLSGKLDKGKEWFAANGTYTINNLIDGIEPNEPSDGFLVLGNLPVSGGFSTMSGFTEIVEESTVNGATGSTPNGEPDGISTSAQFRNGPMSGILNSLSMQATGVDPSTGSNDPLGGLIFALTLEASTGI